MIVLLLLGDEEVIFALMVVVLGLATTSLFCSCTLLVTSTGETLRTGLDEPGFNNRGVRPLEGAVPCCVGL